ncbi:bifunctional 2-polyprenyl-6-hydroxyphenol methylase/3-demethylubiquinol 3-O-methyltransferase UbiG [Cupriavidus sp. UYPR2.512]|uniref:class I SAM-dependent methyltransferase n=1 Tax=Cupriavidus sp. UYPR2.512 TaxID=1080187 RepID=UPI0003768670|nr:class I SAM-dependent methyltransferase [Cupriavidus sp. UYPR2.512]UIF86867.1 class I SAM-dependent methyltransferase [Cupriavidus necator]
MSPDAYLEMAETEATHWWFRGRREIVATILSGLALPRDASILEIGAGTGGNLAMLSQFGKISAVEMDGTALRLAREKTLDAYDIRSGRCPDDMPFPEHSFDLVCLLDCLEHIADDAGSLDCAARLLKAGGAVFLTVPAYQWLWSAHDVFLHHQRRYSKRSLHALANRCGMHVERVSYFNTVLFPLAVAARVSDRLSGNQKATGAGLPPRPLNHALHRLFSTERHWLARRSLPFGISLMAILRTS